LAPVIAVEPSRAEHELAVRVIDTLLREDYGGLSKWVRPHPAGPALHLPADQGRTEVVLPLESDGFLADARIRRTARAGLPGYLPGAGCPPLTLDDVDALLTAVADPLDSDGADAFALECRQALATLRLRQQRPPAPQTWLARRSHASAWLGARGQLGYDALAAAMPHPVYPTSESRLGFSDDDSLRYAPEYLPEFELGWVAVRRSALVLAGQHGRHPPGWPTLPQVGLPASLAATHDLMPVHPLTVRRQLAAALAEAGLAGLAGPGRATRPPPALIAPGTSLRVSPTLSVRTVAVVGDPCSHIKLPLPTSTLGLRNRRHIQPGTLADGALVRGVLAAAADGDEMLGGLLLADESTYAHASHPYLAYLLRRIPAGLGRCRIVSLGALLAPSPRAGGGAGRPLVIEELAGGPSGSDVLRLLDAYLGLLFDTHVRLFVRYGIALEAHQQNTALVLGPPGRPAGSAGSGAAGRVPRLLVKDFDGALIHHPRLVRALGPRAPGRSAFADSRLLTGSDDALADVFITIVVHLCAGALAFGLADRGVAALPDLLALVRRKLVGALDRHEGWPATAVLRSRVLDADRLPGKSMVTAGTLVAKSRTGASDVNKFYGTSGPNYLRANDPRSSE
jgi:siderophore synthetase component